MLRLTPGGFPGWAVLLLWLSLMVGSASGQATLIADTHVNAALPAMNSGAISNVNIGGGYTGLLQFDLSLLPAGTTSAKISRAVLRVYVNRMDTAGLVSIAPVTSAWGEYSVTYQTIPATGAAAQVVSISQAGAFVAVDVTSLVQGWVAAPATNFGVALTAGTAVLEIDSKENDLTGHAATLDVTIVSQGPAGATGPIGPTGPVGPAGPQGIPGANGAAGPAGANGLAGATGPAGPAGPAGANGLPGVTGTQGIQGLPGLGFEGSYTSTTNYGLDDVVEWQGSSYISLMAGNHGNTPGQVPGTWALLAAAGVGSAGPAGATGATGPQGSVGPAGPIGATGPQGVAGATGAAGLPGLVYQGTYVSTTNYASGDVVLWGGSSYASLMNGNHGNTPSLSPAQWGVLTAQGPAGPTGATGTAGPVGATGASGPMGSPGPTGPQGPQGIAGIPGVQGLTGAAGAQGPAGPTGLQGVAGPVGLAFQGLYDSTVNYALADGVSWNGAGYVSLIAGNHGNTPDQSPSAWALFAAAGAPGAAGAIGPAGQTGPAGPQGLTGAAGPVGPQGPQGPQGPAVVNYTGNYASPTNYGVADAVSFGGSTYVSLVAANHGNTPGLSPTYWAVLAAQGVAGTVGPQGPQGLAGAAGASGPAGAVGPQGSPVTFAGGWLTGTAYAVGDAVSYGGSSYIATVANTGRQPDVSPTYWGLLAAAGSVGATGPAGATGLQGPTGYPGPTGATGATGAAGPMGPTGPAGATGPVGPAGVAGPAGAAGLAGLIYQGSYSSATNYGVNDAVTFQGASYISLAGSNAGNTPGASPAFWSLLAAAGATGLQGAAGVHGVDGTAGAAGPAGPQGIAGATGAAGADGAPGLVYRGGYASGTNYALNDAVLFQGSSYISLTAGNSGNTPGASPADWSLLAAQGAVGATGAAGVNGTAGATGPQGPQGLTGPQGATGAAGMNFRGAWTSGAGYGVNDAVTYGGATYLAQAPSNGVQPDSNAADWTLLAAAGSAGPTGAAGVAATVQVGTVTTGAAGSSAAVTNSGTANAVVLNFTIPQGVAGSGGGGSGGGGTSGIPFQTMYHAVSYANTYYSVNNTNQSASESAAVLTWVPNGCSATQLVAFSQQAATITVTLRTGTPGAMSDSALSCSAATGQSCSANGSVTIPTGGFADVAIYHPDSNPSGVWVAVSCN